MDHTGPIKRFFDSYSKFQYNPSRSSFAEFQRLRKLYGWTRGNAAGDKAWSDFRLALVKEFNGLFGTDEHDLLAWQNLCAIVGIEDRVESCEDCASSLKARYFNLVDVIDVRRRGSGVAQVFLTKEALQEHTIQRARFFPYNCPKAGNLLRRVLQRPRPKTVNEERQALLASSLREM